MPTTRQTESRSLVNYMIKECLLIGRYSLSPLGFLRVQVQNPRQSPPPTSRAVSEARRAQTRKRGPISSEPNRTIEARDLHRSDASRFRITAHEGVASSHDFRYSVASKIKLNGVCVARRKCLNPPAEITSLSRFSPACAPKASPTS